MRVTPKPNLNYVTVLKACTEGVGDSEVRKRLRKMEANLVGSSKFYESEAQSEKLYSLQEFCINEVIAPLVLNSDLKKLYINQMAKKDRPGRMYYDGILDLAPRGLCPFCGISSAKELDHILPKSKFPCFSIFPLNLVPICRDCNSEKSDQIATSIEEQKIHPYFDDFTNDQWLFAEVRNDTEPVIIFNAITKSEWGDEKISKISSHLMTYDLYERFGDLASEELANIKNQLQKLYDNGDARRVKSELLERADSFRKVNLNSWQTAMYQALAGSDWYCDGGFALAG